MEGKTQKQKSLGAQQKKKALTRDFDAKQQQCGRWRWLIRVAHARARGERGTLRKLAIIVTMTKVLLIFAEAR